MGNIGYRPTINNSDLTIEVHIFDFDLDIYGETITIFFVDRIRDEIKFENLEALKQQLIKDKKIVLGIL
jgi:riboflavin kinase/FMN adenylyltransferase